MKIKPDTDSFSIIGDSPQIRELANFVERMVVLSIGSTITPRDLPDKVLGEVPKDK